MSVDRMMRVNALLKREIGEAMFRIPALSRLDLSAITVTRVDTGRSLRSATVFVSIRDHAAERPRILGALKKNRGQIQRLISRDCVLKFTPCLTFVLDESIERGDHILGILASMDTPAGEEGDDPPSGDAPAGGSVVR